ncbi:hypothetical protein DFP73DRAFT_595680 [Morchella snyderi]|nr:hypothetical protein DFP73DRAFT_595680 [Morchella snyderi]
MSLPSFSAFVECCAVDVGCATTHYVISSVSEEDIQSCHMLGLNPNVHGIQELDRDMFMGKNEHYTRRRTFDLLDIHHNSKKNYRFFVKEGALQRI